MHTAKQSADNGHDRSNVQYTVKRIGKCVRLDATEHVRHAHSRHRNRQHGMAGGIGRGKLTLVKHGSIIDDHQLKEHVSRSQRRQTAKH